MKQRVFKILIFALVLAALGFVLSGCVVNPDNNTTVETTSSWKKYTIIPDNTTTPNVVTPTPSPDPYGQSYSTNTPFIESVTKVPSGYNGGESATNTPVLGGATATPEATASPSVLKRGMNGTAVANVQSALKRLGYFEGKCDGDFGEYTENAVKNFQAQNGLTADGVVGAATLAKLGSSTAFTAPPKATATPKVTATPKKTATPKPTATPKVDNVYLRLGNSGTQVTKMQNRLIELGYLYGSATGTVCSLTEAAVVAFQQRNSLGNDGVAGPSTLQKLYSSSAKKANSAVGIIGVTLKKGAEGAAVRLLQNKLKAYGFLTGTVDGSFGDATEKAVKSFQSANGLTADGCAGASTLQKLFEGSVTKATQTATPKVTAKATATAKPTATPNMYIRVTEAPKGSYATLERGMMGTPVKELQQALKNLGYYSGTCDGYFGEATEVAVKKFQKAKGLVQDGKAGPATQRYLFEGDFPSES